MRQRGWAKSSSVNRRIPLSADVSNASFLEVTSGIDSTISHFHFLISEAAAQVYACDMRPELHILRELDKRINALPENFSSVPNPFSHSTSKWPPPATQVRQKKIGR